MKEGYIKGDRTKHISPIFFFTHDLQKNGKINIHQIHGNDNIANLFINALPIVVFEKLVHNIGFHRLKDIN